MDVKEQMLDDLLEEFWKKKAEKTEILDGVIEVLGFLKGRGIVLVILAENDGKRGVKK